MDKIGYVAADNENFHSGYFAATREGCIADFFGDNPSKESCFVCRIRHSEGELEDIFNYQHGLQVILEDNENAGGGDHWWDEVHSIVDQAFDKTAYEEFEKIVREFFAKKLNGAAIPYWEGISAPEIVLRKSQHE
jgi:hypothetical protein